MHSLAPYLVRCFNSNLPGKNEDKYAVLDEIGSHDTFDLLQKFISLQNKEFSMIEEEKLVYRFADFKFDTSTRLISGWFQLGHYGTKTDIINVKTNQIDFKKTQMNAEIINHFIYISLPKSYNKGIVLLHAVRNNGIKTVFFNLFSEYFKNVTNFNFQMNPLSYDKALSEWDNAITKEIRLIKFTGLEVLNDIADRLKNLGHNDEQVMLFKPKRSKDFGRFIDFFNKDSEQAKIIELLTPLCSQVKAVVDLNGRKRVFSVGNNSSNSICEIEAPDNIVRDFENLEYESIHNWCHGISQEFAISLYPKK